jgi:hypothetical protein
MPTSTVETSKDVTVTIPGRCAQRIRAEALGELSMAGENVVEAAAWFHSGEDSVRLDAAELPRMREADLIWGQVRDVDGDLTVTGPRAVVASLLRCCVRSAADDLRDETEGLWKSDVLRMLAAELVDWADVFDATGLSTAQGSRGAAA